MPRCLVYGFAGRRVSGSGEGRGSNSHKIAIPLVPPSMSSPCPPHPNHLAFALLPLHAHLTLSVTLMGPSHSISSFFSFIHRSQNILMETQLYRTPHISGSEAQ